MQSLLANIHLRFFRRTPILAGWLAAGVVLAATTVAQAQLQMLPTVDDWSAPYSTLDGVQHEPVEQILAPAPAAQTWDFQYFPDGLIYRSYLAGVRESRFASVIAHEDDLGWLWDIALGGRFGLFRYGTENNDRPEGWQLDLEGAAFPRLDPLGESTPVQSTDFRFGIPLTYGVGPLHIKAGYYHLSSHLGDEYMIANPDYERHNYSRDALVLGAGYYLTEDIRAYGETSWAGWASSRFRGISEPWEFQFGLEYSPLRADPVRCSPFAAVNAHLREEASFGGNVVAQAGWQWPRGRSGHIFRAGLEYLNGKSQQGSFYDEHEKKLGVGLWYDY